ncbi:hypothetical protein PSC71_02370 [Devosia sp. J2-20]|uniref:hypothetical protein n=1 Tax=Devosia sp. J2-20 TaxID=3026161 RepID=UPI00249B7669|nr:hypothetical protein [Devosia sp. J2-20]WDQ99672.1 hypothetical protein PSC71_02370 [Devosia sp. J2-20]
MDRLKDIFGSKFRTTSPETMLELLVGAASRKVRGKWSDVTVADVSRAGAAMLSRLSEGKNPLEGEFHAMPPIGGHAITWVEMNRRQTGELKTIHLPRQAPRPTVPNARRADIAFRLRDTKLASSFGKKRVSERSPRAEEVWDSQDIDRVSDILAIAPNDVAKLIRWGLLNLCASSALWSLPHRRFISSASLRQLMGAIDLQALSADACSLTWMKFISVKDYKENHPELCWADVIAGLSVGTVPLFAFHSAGPNWAHRLHMFETNSLLVTINEAIRELNLAARNRGRARSVSRFTDQITSGSPKHNFF